MKRFEPLITSMEKYNKFKPYDPVQQYYKDSTLLPFKNGFFKFEVSFNKKIDLTSQNLDDWLNNHFFYLRNCSFHSLKTLQTDHPNVNSQAFHIIIYFSDNQSHYQFSALGYTGVFNLEGVNEFLHNFSEKMHERLFKFCFQNRINRNWFVVLVETRVDYYPYYFKGSQENPYLFNIKNITSEITDELTKF